MEPDIDTANAALLESRGSLQQRRNDVLELFKHPRIPKKLPPARKLYAVVLCMPCYGMGDAVFGLKLRDYLKTWYSGIITVDIVTTNPGLFQRLGETSVIALQIQGSLECRRFARASLPREHKAMTPDLVLIAPLTEGRPVDFLDVRSLIPSSSPFNTYFFSEYNDLLRPDIDFPTGLGKNRMGLLFSSLRPGRFPRQIGRDGTPFALAYVATSQQSPQRCFLNFSRMVAAKYLRKAKKHGEFHVVAPESVVASLSRASLLSLAEGYSAVMAVTKDQENDRVLTTGGDGPVLVLRGDILPVPLQGMQTLIFHSVRDILLTGDQSITDAISACPNGKIVWYQIMDWKMDFAKELARYAHNDALAQKSTSCGGLDHFDFNKTSCDVLRKWDFRVHGKKKLDKAVAHALYRRAHPSFAREEDSLIRRR